MLPRVPAGAKPPQIHWWGNAFYRVWKDWEQLVIVIRLPWWREVICRSDNGIRREAGMPYFYSTWIQREQLMVSWRRREGWRHGWREA